MPPLSGEDNDAIAAESHPGEDVVPLGSGNEDIRTIEVLADLGIDLIDVPEPAASMNRIATAGHIMDDVAHRGSGMIDSTSGMIQVTRARLKSRFVRAAVDDYAAALAIASEAGSLESAGDSIAEARREWESQPGEKPAYRQWLSEGGSPIRERAARILADLDAVFRNLRLAGLTRAEVEASRRFVNAKLSGDAAPVL
jgi:hypothetical protein